MIDLKLLYYSSYIETALRNAVFKTSHYYSMLDPPLLFMFPLLYMNAKGVKVCSLHKREYPSDRWNVNTPYKFKYPSQRLKNSATSQREINESYHKLNKVS